MNRTRTLVTAFAITLAAGACVAGSCCQTNERDTSGTAAVDSISPVAIDSVIPEDVEARYLHLTEADFRIVAEELGVEVATIKAVVEIEAGKAMNGFWAPGVPIVNCDKSMWRSSRRLVTSDRKAPASASVPANVPAGYPRRAWQKLINARKINEQQANLSTFWGMFQIGGFNYKLCGCKSIEEFVELMSYSELEQLELFVALVKNCGMLPALKEKNWAAFARKYNGASYARKGYHTRMAAAYRRYSRQEK